MLKCEGASRGTSGSSTRNARLSRRQALLALGAALALTSFRVVPRLAKGTLALVTAGPSAGTVVRLERHAQWTPGCDACAVWTLRPSGPVWVVSEWLDWDVERPAGLGIRRYRLKLAPWTALEPL